MGILEVKDASFTLGINVRLIKMDKKTGKVLEQREGHNRCLRTTLMGITKWLNGEFNVTQDYLTQLDWIPRYLGVGTNDASGSSQPGVTSEVSINDTKLLNEISPRMMLPERNKIVNRSTQDYVQLIISTYLPSELYNNYTIAEAGLFANKTGNNCLFRITFPGIKKTEDSIVEVVWTISVISVAGSDEEYVEVDKADMLSNINALLDRFKQKYSSLTTACDDIKNLAIPAYGNENISQEQVDAITLKLGQDLQDLR